MRISWVVWSWILLVLLVTVMPASDAAGDQDERPETIKDLMKNFKFYKNNLMQAVKEMVTRHQKRAWSMDHPVRPKQHLIAMKLDMNRRSGKITNKGDMFFMNRKTNTCNDAIKTALYSGVKTKQYDRPSDDTSVHTELQLMYGKEGKEFMDQAANAQQIVLVYSYYIPCSQNRDSFGECAGDMARYLTIMKNSHPRTYFMVVYESVYNRTNQCVSKLYMDMGGIPFFIASVKLDFKRKSRLLMDLNFPGSGGTDQVYYPWFQAFPREPEWMWKNTLQIMVHCLWKGEFLDELVKDAPCLPIVKKMNLTLEGEKYWRRSEIYALMWYVLTLGSREDKAFREPILQKIGGENARKIYGHCLRYTSCFEVKSLLPWEQRLIFNRASLEDLHPTQSPVLEIFLHLRSNDLLWNTLEFVFDDGFIHKRLENELMQKEEQHIIETQLYSDCVDESIRTVLRGRNQFIPVPSHGHTHINERAAVCHAIKCWYGSSESTDTKDWCPAD